MSTRTILSTLAVLIAALCLSSQVSAQERLRLAWAGFSPTNSPIWVMEDRKLLQKQGVAPEIIAINASPTVLQAFARRRNRSGQYLGDDSDEFPPARCGYGDDR